tara:strand:+ start:357 stop:935 length:579 start_codon:yes stop_codon:yes gene_type:complete
MATLNATNLKHASSGSNNIVLASDGSTTISNLSGGVGKILQVKQTVKTSKQTIQSQSLTDISGLSVSITPSVSTNKILVRYSLVLFTNAVYYSLRLLRDSSDDIFIGDINSSATSQQRASFGSYMASYAIADCITQEFLDSPNDTNAHTYKIQVHCPYSSSYIIGVNSSPQQDNYNYMNNCVSTITVMEVAA